MIFENICAIASKSDFHFNYIKGSLALRGKEPKKTVAKKGTVVAALKKVFTFSRSRVMICLFSPLSTLNRRRRARPQALPRRVCSAFSPTLRPAVKRRWSRVQDRATLIAQELVIRTTLHYPWSLGGRCQTYRAFMACDARRCGSLLSRKKTPSNNHAGSGVEDFDRENAGDPQQHSDYAMETFQYYKNREETFRVPDYLQVGRN